MYSVLLIATKYKHDDGSPWLISEFADEMVAQGFDVTVLNLSWKNSSARKVIEVDDEQKFRRPRIFNFAAIDISFLRAGVALKWALSSFKLIPFLFRQMLLGKRYDIFVSFSPCTAVHAAVKIANSISKKSFLIYWDLFPLHNQAIKKSVPTRVMPLLKGMERRLVSSFDTVLCMGKGNRKVFLDYFRERDSRVGILPIWTSILNSPRVNRLDIRRRYSLPEHALIFVFGGQLVEGRGIKNLCDAFHYVASKGEDVVLAFCGSGPLEAEIKSYEKGSVCGVRLIGALPRTEYMEILAASDVGVISAISEEGTSSFPSKSLDYMACSLPILAVLELGNDLGRTILEKNMGVVCDSDDVRAISLSIEELIRQRADFELLGANGNSHLNVTHSVSKVVEKFTEIANV